jgi:hypothetical protein
MTPARRTAEIQTEVSLDTGAPTLDLADRQAGIAQSAHATGRGVVALLLAMHRPLTISSARLALSAAPLGLDLQQAQAWTARIVEADQDSIGATHGH